MQNDDQDNETSNDSSGIITLIIMVIVGVMALAFLFNHPNTVQRPVNTPIKNPTPAQLLNIKA